jgi:GAF domain-containing protein
MSTPMIRDGALAGAVVVFRDITERKQFEEAITQRNAELAAQNTIAATLNQSLHLDAVLNTTLDAVLSIFEMEVGGIFLLDPISELLTLRTYRGKAAVEGYLPSAHPLRLDECLSGQAIIEMQPILLKNIDFPPQYKHAHLAPFISETNPQTLVSTPLVSRGYAIGALTMGTSQPKTTMLPRLDLLATIGQQIGMALENARLYQETEDLAEQLTVLHQASIILSTTHAPDELYTQITALASKLLDCQITCMYVWDDVAQKAENVSNYTVDQPDAVCQVIPHGELPCLYELVARRRSIAIEDAQNDSRVPEQWRTVLDVRALLCLPLWTKDKPLGLLFLIDQRAPRHWRPDEIILAQSFANRATIAVENAYLHQEIEKTATMQERQRIATELHDGVGQTLSYIGLKVDHVTEVENAAENRVATDELERVRTAVDQATRELRGRSAICWQSRSHANRCRSCWPK